MALSSRPSFYWKTELKALMQASPLFKCPWARCWILNSSACAILAFDLSTKRGESKANLLFRDREHQKKKKRKGIRLRSCRPVGTKTISFQYWVDVITTTQNHSEICGGEKKQEFSLENEWAVCHQIYDPEHPWTFHPLVIIYSSPSYSPWQPFTQPQTTPLPLQKIYILIYQLIPLLLFHSFLSSFFSIPIFHPTLLLSYNLSILTLVSLFMVHCPVFSLFPSSLIYFLSFHHSLHHLSTSFLWLFLTLSTYYLLFPTSLTYSPFLIHFLHISNSLPPPHISSLPPYQLLLSAT